METMALSTGLFIGTMRKRVPTDERAREGLMGGKSENVVSISKNMSDPQYFSFSHPPPQQHELIFDSEYPLHSSTQACLTLPLKIRWIVSAASQHFS